ncbi:exosome complex component RRP40-like [Oppia nitens]|uniref:exosome complex component RRP40-like n=1 Tax=Oppia nitens TaxID=1686743 RepID=UPI0023DBAE6E|nr:exosome complex component RRP40-like [Oppia nitens]
MATTITTKADTLIVLPGEDITPIIAKYNVDTSTGVSGGGQVMVGPGLKREPNSRIMAVKCGQLINRNNRAFWLDSHFKRYTPSKGDRIVGFVTSKQAYQCKVDIRSNEVAVLSLLAFPNATKRNKPPIEVGDAVYAQVITDCPYVEAELVCVTSDGKKGGLGVLPNTGYVLTVATDICRQLLAPDSPILKTLGKRFKFETAIGMNGNIWINSGQLDTTLTIVNFIESLEHIPKHQHLARSQQLAEQTFTGKR